ncbi:MAG: PEP-utilizing enzyme, partial [Elusimicrobiales bacterium]|nr:PEP-utilizing enzyme [Elusimicrobiales bacterium]
SADWRFTLDARTRRLDCPPGSPLDRRAATRLLAVLASARNELFPSGGAAFEFLVSGGEPIFLQARPLPREPEKPRADMPGLYARITAAMRGLGLAPRDWSLAETADVAAFNFLGLARPADERLEHFRIRISPAARAKIARRGWVSVKYDDDDDTVFPSELPPRRRAALERLGRDGVFIIFVLQKKGERPLRRTLSFARGSGRFRMAFSYAPEGLEKEEERDLLKREPAEAAAWLERLARERGVWLAVRRELSNRRACCAYGRALLRRIPGELELIARKERLARRAASRAASRRGGMVIRGLPFRARDAVIEGPAVTAGRAASWEGPPFIYCGHDLEPCFLPLMDRIKAVVVSRGAFGSHAAQICSELGVPLILETSNLSLVKDGDRLRLDLRTGSIGRNAP